MFTKLWGDVHLNIKQIAEAAGVSPATVSNALNGRKNVGEATRQRILALCQEMDYTDDNRRRRTVQGNRTILFNFSDFDRQFYLKIIQGISDCVYANDYDLIISTSRSCERFMSRKITSGCIMLDMHCTDELLENAADKDYPILAMDRELDHPFIKSLVVNNYAPMREMMEELVSRGYRTFAFLAGLDTTDTRERYLAFRHVLEKHNIPFNRKNYLLGDFREHSGYKAAKLLMLSEDMPQVLVCANDHMAIGAMRAFRERGIHVPRDIAVTGFDGTNLASELGLTTVDIPNYERGYLAAQQLLALLHGSEDYSTFKIAASVHMRESVLPHFSK
ncbi:MAG: LacI family DNA-binding transcriptional regulator [Eubacteriales bacterium]|nr:LacI family DNA-binding transcriptional regulator [Eubacteriales bacterium]